MLAALLPFAKKALLGGGGASAAGGAVAPAAGKAGFLANMISPPAGETEAAPAMPGPVPEAMQNMMPENMAFPNMGLARLGAGLRRRRPMGG